MSADKEFFSLAEGEDVAGDGEQGVLRATDRDRNDMQRMDLSAGLQRNFKTLGMLSFASNLIISPEYMLGSLAYSLYNGGRRTLLFGPIIHLPAVVCNYWGLAEMMSM